MQLLRTTGKTQNVFKKLREAIEALSVFQIDDENPDIVIAIGGDGTLMSAFHKYFDQIDHIGFVSIHTGQLVFYTWHELTIEEIIETLSQDKIPMTADPLVQATVTLENEEETMFTSTNSYLKGSMVMDSVFQLQRAQLLITSHSVERLLVRL